MFLNFTCILLFPSQLLYFSTFLTIMKNQKKKILFFSFKKCFDITRKVTYLNLKTWYNEMREHCPHIPCILVANKIDGKYFI